MAAPTPRMHGLTHVPGGSDPIPGLTGGGVTGLAGMIESHPFTVGFWKLNETAGDIAADSAGGYNMDSGAAAQPTWGQPAGPPGETSALFGIGLGERNTAVPALTGDLTLEIWANRNTVINGQFLIGQGWSTAANGAGVTLFINNSTGGTHNKLTAYIGDTTGGPHGIESDLILNINEWHHCVVTRTAHVWRLYLDGALQTATYNDGGTDYSPAGGAWIGSPPADLSYVCDGLLSYAAVYNGALTAAEILQHYQAADGPPVTTADLSAKVDRDAVAAATNRLVQVKLAAGDTQPAFRIGGDGKQQWGPGGTTAPDTNLYRQSVANLQTDGNLWVGKTLVMDAVNAASWLVFGGSFDTNLYRPAAATLKTDAALTAKVLAGRAGADLAASGGVVTVTGGLHRITSTTGNIATINGGFDGALVTLINRTGGVLSFVTGGNIQMASSPSTIAANGARVFVFSAPDAAWQTIG